MSNKILYKSVEDELPIFYKSWWLDAVCDGKWEAAIVEKKGEIVAIWPYLLENKFGFKLLRNPLLTPYLGPFILQKKDIEEEESLINKLLNQLPKTDFLQFTTVPHFHNFLPLLHNGISNTNRITYEIDLTKTEEAILEQVQKRRKRYIKNDDSDLSIKEANQYCEEFIKIHRQTFENKGIKYPYSVTLLNRLMNAGKHNNSSSFLVIVDAQNRLVAGLWNVYDKSKAYQILSAFPLQKEYPNAMILLTWHAILHAKSIGIKFYDFEGSIDKGIEQFFRKFGGERCNYLYFEKTNSFLWKIKKLISS